MKNSLPEDIICCWCCFNFLLLLLSLFRLSSCFSVCSFGFCHYADDVLKMTVILGSVHDYQGSTENLVGKQLWVWGQASCPEGVTVRWQRGKLATWLPVFGDLEGKKAGRLIIPSIDFALHFPLCCGHVSMPRASVPRRIDLRPAGVDNKRSFLADWLDEGEVCRSGCLCSLYIFLTSLPVFNPAPPLTP